jgi:hypothetical protein
MNRRLRVSWGRALARTAGQRQEKGAQEGFPLPGSHLPRGEVVAELELLTTGKPVGSLWTPSTEGGIGASIPLCEAGTSLTTSPRRLFVGLNYGRTPLSAPQKKIYWHSTMLQIAY